MAYNLRGKYDIAIADYNKAIELDPQLAVAFYNRGMAYYQKGQYSEAIADFENVVNISADTELVNKARHNIDQIRQQE